MESQFSPTARDYATSPTHANADDLKRLVNLVQPKKSDSLLDIATGAGNVALAFAPFVSRVVAYDLTASMLEETHRRAEELGYGHLTVVQGPAEELPFEDGSFEIVTVRTAPHHFSNIQAAVSEMARVTRPGGTVLIVDTCSPEDDEADSALNDFERLRDRSHVRNYRPSEWGEMVEAAGLTLRRLEVADHGGGKKLNFRLWCDRMRVDDATREELERRLDLASGALREVLKPEIVDGERWFTLPEITLLATKG
ncbi:MAG: class I SAM-dependent methyltransferase [Fimbriimonas sp.]